MLEQARKLLESVSAAPNAPESGPSWKSLHALLKKAPYDQMRLARFIATRDVAEMRKVLEAVAKAPPPAPRGSYNQTNPDGTPVPRPAPPPLIQIRAEKPTSQQLKTALAAFKKRLKLTKLDQESRISGHSPLSGGAKSGIVAILPPNLYPRNYWEELEKQGQIRNTGGGFYELVEKAKPIKGDAPAAGASADGAETGETSEAESEPSSAE